MARSARLAVRVSRSSSSGPTRKMVSGDLSRTSQQRFHSGEQFDKRKRLGQIVVAARPQPAHAVVYSAESAENENRRADALASQCFNHREAIEPRQHPINNQDVRFAGPSLAEAVEAVRGPLDSIAAFRELCAYFASRLGVVFNQKHFAPAGRPRIADLIACA